MTTDLQTRIVRKMSASETPETYAARDFTSPEKLYAVSQKLERENAELKESLGAISYASIKVQRENAELRAYADKLAQGLPDGMLPKDVENLRDANLAFANENAELRGKLSALEEENARLREELNTSAEGEG